QNRTQTCGTVNRNRLSNGHRTVSSRVKRVDFAACGGFADCSSKRLARGRATTRIDIISDAGDPCSRRLCVSKRGTDCNQTKNRQNVDPESESIFVHKPISFLQEPRHGGRNRNPATLKRSF